MTKFVLNYLKVYEPGKYFFRRKFGKKARQKRAELRFLIHDDIGVNYRKRVPDSHFIFRLYFNLNSGRNFVKHIFFMMIIFIILIDKLLNFVFFMN